MQIAIMYYYQLCFLNGKLNKWNAMQQSLCALKYL